MEKYEFRNGKKFGGNLHEDYSDTLKTEMYKIGGNELFFKSKLLQSETSIFP